MHTGKFFSKVAILSGFLLLMFAPVAGAQSKAGTTVVSTTKSATYTPGSAGYDDVVQWLKARSFDDNRQPLSDFDKLGTLIVVYQSAPRSNATLDPGGPMMPLPPGHNGDTITISSCSGGWKETWSYVYVVDSTGQGWVLTSYTRYHTTSCSVGSQ
jgi:hypothetical protein